MWAEKTEVILPYERRNRWQDLLWLREELLHEARRFRSTWARPVISREGGVTAQLVTLAQAAVQAANTPRQRSYRV